MARHRRALRATKPGLASGRPAEARNQKSALRPATQSFFHAFGPIHPYLSRLGHVNKVNALKEVARRARLTRQERFVVGKRIEGHTWDAISKMPGAGVSGPITSQRVGAVQKSAIAKIVREAVKALSPEHRGRLLQELLTTPNSVYVDLPLAGKTFLKQQHGELHKRK